MQGNRESGRVAPRPAVVPPFWFSKRKGWSPMTGGPFMKDRDLANLANDVKVLDLKASYVSDTGLAYLRDLNSLTELRLNGTGVTDDGLVHLRGLPRLTTLYLGATRVTDAGLVHLSGCTSLTTLDLGYTRVTDDGLVHLE